MSWTLCLFRYKTSVRISWKLQIYWLITHMVSLLNTHTYTHSIIAAVVTNAVVPSSQSKQKNMQCMNKLWKIIPNIPQTITWQRYFISKKLFCPPIINQSNSTHYWDKNYTGTQSCTLCWLENFEDSYKKSWLACINFQCQKFSINTFNLQKG